MVSARLRLHERIEAAAASARRQLWKQYVSYSADIELPETRELEPDPAPVLPFHSTSAYVDSVYDDAEHSGRYDRVRPWA